jgi:hypothetical protein
MGGSLCSCDPHLERLSPDLEDLAPGLRQFIQEQEAVVRQGHLPRQGPLAAADHANSGDGVVGGPQGARRDEGGAPTRQAGDAMNPRGLQRFRPAHRGQDRGEAPRQHRLPRPGGRGAGDYGHNAHITFRTCCAG